MSETAGRLDEPQLALTTPVGRIPGVRPREAEALRSMGIRAAAHLLTHLPSRYEREREETSIAELEPESLGRARGEVTACRVAGPWKRRRFEAVLSDGTGRLNLVWFNAPYMQRKIGAGTRLLVSGKVRHHGDGLQMANPRLEVLTERADESDSTGLAAAVASGERLRPVYPASESIRSAQIEAIVARAMPALLPHLEEHLPPEVLAERGLPGLAEAYCMVHAPQAVSEAERGRRRLAYDELLMLQLGVFLKRAYVRRHLTAPALRADDRTRAAILRRLPFELTGAQARVMGEIASDLSQTVPANRLIQGDVGSGKTAVAVSALLMAVASGFQGALMAPTELLTRQHDRSIRSLLAGSDVRIELLSGALSAAERGRALDRIGAGEVDIVVGTHALLSEAVRFRALAVAVIDEQHRFGVEQRAMLRQRGPDLMDGHGYTTPHTLVLTATPIPRTLAMTLFGDLEVSTIDELPPGRTPVETVLLRRERLDRADALVAGRIAEGERAFVVVPAVEGGCGGELASVSGTAQRLKRGALAGRRVATLHGQMKTRTREIVMERFRRGLIDCLVATTVIEVGVDVPDATVMMIENAERFGLAQLHQLRGRVGRGDKPSICVLVGDLSTEDAERRLTAMEETSDGFVLAERDLEIRGPGELLGQRQAGVSGLLIADLSRDLDLLKMARRDAAAWIERSPELAGADDAVMRRRLVKRHGSMIGLADVG